MTTIHRCFLFSAHNIYMEVGMVTTGQYFCSCMLLLEAASGIESSVERCTQKFFLYRIVFALG